MRITGFLCLGTALVILVLSLTFSFKDWQDSNRVRPETRQIRQLYDGTVRLLALVNEAETIQRTFLLTGDESYLQRYGQAAAAVGTESDALDQLPAATPGQQELVNQLGAAVRRELTELRLVIELRQSRGFAAALTEFRREDSKNGVREIAGRISKDAAARLASSAAAADVRGHHTRVFTASVTGVLLCLLLLAGLTLNREVARREHFIAALRDSEQRTAGIRDLLHTTLSSVGDAVIATDANGVITFFNSVAGQLTGWPQAEALGRPLEAVFAVMNESTGQPIENVATKVIHEGAVVRMAGQTALQGRDGRFIPIDAGAAAIRDDAGRTIGLVLVFHGETARREAEAELRQSEQRFRRLFDCNPIGLTLSNADGRITEANDAYLAIIGYQRSEFTPGKIGWSDLTPPEYRAQDNQALLVAGAETTSQLREQEYLLRDGTRKPVVIGVAEFNAARGEWLSFVLDISERKRMEEQLLHSQKLESLSVLAGGIAHEFNNLFMGIIANATLMLDEAAPGSPLERLVDNVSTATEKAANLTRQMLEYSGRGRLAVEPLDLAEQVRSLISLVQASVPHRVELRLDLAAGLPLIDADAQQVRQLVTNLVLNGAEAISTQGEVTISTSYQDLTESGAKANIAGAPLPPGAYVTLEVRDNGAGMDEATRARMFDPFFSTKFTGRGLGLAAVLGIVRGHKGGIVVSTQPGQGTAFQVLFPVAKESAVGVPAGSSR